MPDLVAASLISLAAGFVNSIAGGGGLVSLPLLFALFPAAPPATLFGTNKAAMICGTAWASASYARRVRVPWRTLGPAIAAALGGGCLGAACVTLVSGEWIRRLLPLLLFFVFVITAWRKDLGHTHAPRLAAPREALLASLIALVVGFYDGFFGPGTGSFFIFLFVKVLGYDFLHAVAAAKILNTATNLASLLVFAGTGHVWWKFVLAMAVANVVGSALGTSLALHHGSRIIRPVFLAVVAALIVKTGCDAYINAWATAP